MTISRVKEPSVFIQGTMAKREGASLSELWARHRPKEMKVPIQLSAMRHEYIYLALMHDASAGLLVLLQLSRAGWFATI